MTTSYARLRLLKMLRQLDSRSLYFDTDSVIYTSKPGQWEPSLGNILGDWDNQLEKGESHIVSFASLGPKTYTYTTDTGRVEMKIVSMEQISTFPCGAERHSIRGNTVVVLKSWQ